VRRIRRPPAAIREFNVNTGVYQAEYGRAAGRRDQLGDQERPATSCMDRLTSRPRELVGCLQRLCNKYGRDAELNCYPFTSTDLYNFTTSPIKPEDSRRIWGFNAGGWLIKDKLFWEYTYDQHRRIFPERPGRILHPAFYTQPDGATGTGKTRSFPPAAPLPIPAT